MRICASAPKSTERGSLIVSFDALTGLFIAMGLVLGNIARRRGKKRIIREHTAEREHMMRAGRGRRVRRLGLALAVALMPAIARAADSWNISIGVRETGTSAAVGRR